MKNGNYFETPKSDNDGRITLSLEPGTYYVRGDSDATEEYEVAPFAFKVPDDGNFIYSKTIKKTPALDGKVRLYKCLRTEKLLKM